MATPPSMTSVPNVPATSTMVTGRRRLIRAAADALRCSPVGLARVMLGLFLTSLIASTTADADLWGHVRFGLDMLASRAIHATDAYSFTSDTPWVNHEWLAELVMALAYTWLGALGLNLVKVGCIAVVAAMAFVIAREEDATPLARDVFAGLVVFSAYTRMQAVRPQLFSIALFAVLLYLIRQVDRGRLRCLWGVPLVFAAWVNLHGGWLVGFGAFGIWLVARILERTSTPVRLALLATGMGAALATLVNPYGSGLWNFLAMTVRLERPDITDWKSLLELPAGVLAFEAILPSVAVMCLWRTSFRAPLRYAAVIAMLVFATFRIGRTDAFTHVAIAILLSPQIIGGLNALEQRVSTWRPLLWRAARPVGVIALCLIVAATVSAARTLRTIAIQGPWIPDPAGAMFLRDQYAGARVLTWFDWGEYALWHLSPVGASVSMDGRRETVYSQRVISDHFAFYRADPGTFDYPDRISADVVWLPREFPSVGPLRNRGWVAVFESCRSVVLARSRPMVIPSKGAPPVRAAFPGP